MVLLLRKLYFYFTKDPEAVHYFPVGGVQLFPGGGGGVQMLISIETHIRTCYFPGGVSGPPLDPHMGNVIKPGHICHSPASNYNCQSLICQYYWQVRFSK